MKNMLKKMGIVVLMVMLFGNMSLAFAEEVIEISAEPTVEATAEPTVEATVEPTVEATVEPTVEATAEPIVEVTVEPTVEAAAEPTVEPAPFTGEVEVKLENDGEIFFGDTVTLRAVVSEANADYAICWEVNKAGCGDSWETLSGETGSTYSFEVTEENAAYAYRAVLVVAE